MIHVQFSLQTSPFVSILLVLEGWYTLSSSNDLTRDREMISLSRSCICSSHSRLHSLCRSGWKGKLSSPGKFLLGLGGSTLIKRETPVELRVVLLRKHTAERCLH